MGVVLDSSVIIAAERRNHTVRQILEQLKKALGDIEIGLSVISIAELVHGAYRSKTKAQQEQRLEFVARLSSDLPVYPVTVEIAYLAGRIEGEQLAAGIQLAIEDVLIGATALRLGYSVATLNRRDFQKIPGLPLCSI